MCVALGEYWLMQHLYERATESIERALRLQRQRLAALRDEPLRLVALAAQRAERSVVVDEAFAPLALGLVIAAVIKLRQGFRAGGRRDPP